MNLFFKIVSIFLLVLISACDLKLIPKKKKEIKLPKINCPISFKFTKKEYLPKNKEINQLLAPLDSIDILIQKGEIKETKESVNKYSSFNTYFKNKKLLKIVSDICIKDLNLSATKHETYFIDQCTVISRMTKFAYRSKRINSIYYFLFKNLKYIGCIVMHQHTLFHKKNKWVNITNEKLALNWSNRIYNNIIRPNLK